MERTAARVSHEILTAMLGLPEGSTLKAVEEDYNRGDWVVHFIHPTGDGKHTSRPGEPKLYGMYVNRYFKVDGGFYERTQFIYETSTDELWNLQADIAHPVFVPCQEIPSNLLPFRPHQSCLYQTNGSMSSLRL